MAKNLVLPVDLARLHRCAGQPHQAGKEGRDEATEHRRRVALRVDRDEQRAARGPPSCRVARGRPGDCSTSPGTRPGRRCIRSRPVVAGEVALGDRMAIVGDEGEGAADAGPALGTWGHQPEHDGGQEQYRGDATAAEQQRPAVTLASPQGPSGLYDAAPITSACPLVPSGRSLGASAATAARLPGTMRRSTWGSHQDAASRASNPGRR